MIAGQVEPRRLSEVDKEIRQAGWYRPNAGRDFFALRNEKNFARSMAESVSIDGDSSAVAMITGSILGTSIGASRLPDEMVFNIELSDVVAQVADDLDQRYVADPEDKYGGAAQSWWDKYPGW